MVDNVSYMNNLQHVQHAFSLMSLNLPCIYDLFTLVFQCINVNSSAVRGIDVHFNKGMKLNIAIYWEIVL